MFEDLPRLTREQLNELRGDAPLLLSRALTILEGFEAAPTTQRDAKRSIESLIRANKSAKALTSGEVFEYKQPKEVVALLDSCLDVLEDTFSSLENLPSPVQLVMALDQAQSSVEPAFWGSEDYCRQIVNTLVQRYTNVQQAVSRFEAGAFCTIEEVQADESARLLVMEPDNPVNHFRLGEALYAKGELSEALTHLRTAYLKAPKAPHHVYFLARCHADLGNSEEALALAKEAVKLPMNISNSLCWELLGETSEALGLKQEAVDAYLQGTRCGWSNISCDRALQRLAAYPEIQISRPPNFTCPDHDERLEYYSNGHDANCRVRIFSKENGQTVVLASQDDLQTGQSITNAAELIAEEVVRKFKIKPKDLIWLEAYQEQDRALIQMVQFEVTEDGKFRDPVWQPLSNAEFESLTGYRLSWKEER